MFYVIMSVAKTVREPQPLRHSGKVARTAQRLKTDSLRMTPPSDEDGQRLARRRTKSESVKATEKPAWAVVEHEH